MDDIRIEDKGSLNMIETSGLRGSPGKHCLYYKEEICQPDKLKFAACKTCYRFNSTLAIKDLFAKIKKLATDIFNLPEAEPDQFPPRK
jgi:hypothetical protein